MIVVNVKMSKNNIKILLRWLSDLGKKYHSMEIDMDCDTPNKKRVQANLVCECKIS